MRRLSLVNLETLCWIARLGSFTAAAERLNTTQPAISRRVRELEHALRIDLFHRQGRRMELTIQGRDLVNRTQPLLNRLDEVVLSLENPEAATGTVRMGVGEMVTLTWFADMMAILKRDMPRVNYEIEVGLTIDMHQKLEMGTLDLAIVAAPMESKTITARPIGNARVQWLMAKSLKAAQKRRASVKELLESNTIWSIARPAQLHQMVAESLRKYNVASASVNTSNNLQGIIEVVASGAGIAMLPTYALRKQGTAATLVPVSSQLPAEQLGFSIASHRDQDQAILQHIIEVASRCCDFADQ
jgi:DNA-binding transcriptional LysR family regulator